MPYCPRCGVEVEERMEACPLCDTQIPEEVRGPEAPQAPYPEDSVPPRRMYRKLTEKQRQGFILSLILLLGLLPILILTVIDLMNNGGFTWSYYAIVGILGTSGILYLFLRYPRKPLISVNGTFLFILVVQILTGYRGIPLEFFQSPEFPFYAIALFIGECILLFLTRGKRKKWYDIVSFSLLMVTLLLLFIEYSLTRQWQWSLISSAALLPVLLYFFYAGRARRRGLNLVGFFFLLLTLMLLALDWLIGFSGWSIITSLIFGVLSLAFYIMHLALFNDTDWKKALHL